ncbi:MAG: hypothetical protein KJ717_09275, partial [Proteobacteria bacterium]|nr:hypothetical protein [Pseudomonadota bacterium]
MKRLLWAGVVALVLHGALLLIKFSSPQIQPPRPLPQGICLTLTAVPQEAPMTAKNEPAPMKKEAKALVKPVARPQSRPKPVPPPPKAAAPPAVVPAAVATVATVQEA